MSTEDDKPEEPMSEFDRMSLNSLKRELEVQKAKTAQAREDAHERIRDSTEGKTPWAKIIGFGAVGLLVIGGGVFALRSSLPPMEEWSLPEFVSGPHDSGIVVEEAAGPTVWVDAGHDAGPAHHRRRRRRHRDAGDEPGQAPTKAPPQLEFGDSDDPIGGLTDED